MFNKTVSQGTISQIDFSASLAERLQKKKKFTKLLVYLVADREALRTRLWFELQGKPIRFKLCKKIYHFIFR